MYMRLYKQLLTNNACYKEGAKLVPKGIMWHSTGANNKKLSRYVQPDDGILGDNKYDNDFNQLYPGGRRVCVHAFIGVDKNGAVATYQTLPWDMRGWHAGGSANDSYIGFEICEDDLTDETYFNAVYKEACELTAYLCKMYNLDPVRDGVVICHSEGHDMGIASNHSDVMHWFKRFNKTMNAVRRDVKVLMSNSDAASNKPGNVLYRVQCGAYSKIENASNLVDKLKRDGYDTYLIKANGLYKVQCGAFANKANAGALAAKLKASGYATYITTNSGTPVTETVKVVDTIKQGDKVRIKAGAKSYDGKKVADFVYSNIYTADQIKGDRVVVGLKSICTAFNIKDLIKA